jgi:hypothetical protein
MQWIFHVSCSSFRLSSFGGFFEKLPSLQLPGEAASKILKGLQNGLG